MDETLTFGSLFSGIGGLDLAMEAAGMQCAWQSEIDEHASRVLAHHWPGVRNLGDITAVNWTGVERVDALCGGFPCTDISLAGKGAGIDGPHSGLWSFYADAIRNLRPRYAFVENVAALTLRGLDRVLRDLHEIGFDAEWVSVRAADVGAPHQRQRLFVLATNTDDQRGDGRLSGRPRWDESSYGAQPAADANRLAGKERHRGSTNRSEVQSGNDVARLGTITEHFGDYGASIGKWEQLTRPAPAATDDGRLNVDFVEWMMGFPQGWTELGEQGHPIKRSQRLKMLGNAVVPAQGAYALRSLLERAHCG